MREFAKIAPQFWTGDTGKAIRKLGPDCQVIALYLITCPSANALGLYYLSLPTLCHETGCYIEGASKALRSLIEVGFCKYDFTSEWVFVPNMARFQIGDGLAPNNKRVIWIRRELEMLRKCPFLKNFLALYRDAFHLDEASPIEGASMIHRRGIEGASAVAAIEIETEIETEKETEIEIETESETEKGADALGPGGPIALSKRDQALAVFDLWNNTVTNLPKARELTDKRVAKCRERLKKHSLDELGVIFRRLDASDFAAGDNDRGWRADFDWIIANDDHPVRVLEGKYDNVRSAAGRKSASQSALEAVMRETLEQSRPSLVEAVR